MNKFKQLFFLSLSLLMVSISSMNAQESDCSDGIDNDSNGFIDNYDPDCYTPPACTITETGQDFDDMLPEIHCSYLDVLATYSAPMVADIDNDGEIEIIVLNQFSHELLVINGTDCTLEGSLSLPSNAIWEKQGNVALGDVDSNGLIDIFLAYGRNNFGNDPQGVLRAEFDGTNFTTHWDVTGVATAETKLLDIIDINQDGVPEIIPNGGSMLNSLTGAVYAGGLPTVNATTKGVYAFSSEADFGNNGNEGNVELILGTSIYRYDFVASTWNLIREIATHNGIIWREYSSTALADLDLDGDLDAIVCGYGSPGVILAWDLQTTTIFSEISEGNIGNGRAAIGNFDDDPEPEFVVVNRTGIIARDDITNLSAGAFTTLWTYLGAGAFPDASAHTQCTLFDFDGDGKEEVVHRGDYELVILGGEGNAGNSDLLYSSGVNSIASGTGAEYPVIADVSGDGQANILSIGQSGSGLGQGLHIFKSSGTPWRTARSIWNTQAYSITNVNEDGTIPTFIQQNSTIYNSYLSQTRPFNGLAPNEWPAADLLASVETDDGDNGAIKDNCPQLGISIEVCNQGDFDVNGGVQISVYDGDPFNSAAAVHIGDYTLNVNPEISECLVDTLYFTPNIGTNFDFYFYVNQDDESVSYPMTMADVSHGTEECNYTNNGFSHEFSCNEPPEPQDDFVSVCGISESVDVLDNDTDPNDNIDNTTLTILTGPENGSANITSGEIVYTPTSGYLGLDSIQYSISDTGFPVESDSAWIHLEVVEYFSTGNSSIVSICTSTGVVDLFDYLGSSADLGGAWTDENGDAISNLFNAGTDAGQAFTYSFQGIQSCSSAPSTINVSTVDAQNAGSDQSYIFCETQGLISLSSILVGASSTSGNWYNSTDNQVSAFFITGTSPDDTYHYVLNGTAPCPTDTSFITITTESSLDPGNPGSLSLCEDASAVNLFNELGGSPDGGGFWTDPNGNFHSGSLDPSLINSGAYTYVHAATSNCPQQNSDIDVSITEQAFPGQNNTVNVCTSQAPFNLFGALLNSPDSGGSWTDPDGNTHTGVFDPENDIEGNYFYTISLGAPCSDVSSFVTINLSNPNSAGEDATLEFCDLDTSQSLTSLLNGTPDSGGTWILNGATISFSNFDPSTHPEGIYTYIVPSSGSCASESAELNITVHENSDAGDDTTVDICNSETTINLFDNLLGTPQNSGTWHDSNDNSISSTLDINTVGTLEFYYVVNGVGSCKNDTSDFTLNVFQQLSPGTDYSIEVCENEISFNLNDSLTSSAIIGGNWFYPDMTPFNGIVQPNAVNSGNYIYEVISPAACSNLTAEYEIDIHNLPDPGLNGANTILCENAPNIDLLTLLNGSPQGAGTWVNPDNDAVLQSFSPLDQPSGIYTYTAQSGNSCPNLTSEISLTIHQILDPGIDTDATACDNSGVIDLFDLLDGTPEIGGNWFINNGSLIPASFQFDTSLGMNQDFVYVHDNDAPCPSSMTNLSVSVAEMTFAGIDNEINICESDSAFDLDTLLAADAAAGEWVSPNNEILASNIFTPGVNTPGEHFYVTTPNPGCEPDSASIIVNLQQLPDAGDDGFLLVCSVSAPVELVGFLGGDPDLNGSWLGPDNSNVDEFFDPSVDSPGQYIYQVFGMAPCPSEAATASVNIVNAPNAGQDSTYHLCATDDPLNINEALAADVTPFRQWTDLDGNPITPVEDPSDLDGNIYQLVAFGDGPCENDTSYHTVMVHQPVEIELTTPVILCSEGELEDLSEFFDFDHFDAFRFKDDNSNLLPEMFNPGIQESQDAWFVIDGLAPCPADSIAFTITIHDPANPGVDTQVDLCSTDPIINTFALLEGDPDLPGLWVSGSDTLEQIDFNPLNNLGINEFEYIAVSPSPCPSYSAILEVDVHLTPEPEFISNVLGYTIENPFFTFDNTTNGIYSYTWIVDETDTLSSFNLEYTFPPNVADIYTICLVAENSVGCQASYCDEVQVKDELTSFIPNSFTPDGDGFNDVFNVNGLGIDQEYFEFYIFSRNGDLVFSTTDLNEGWDGTWNGEEVPSDTYAYRIVVKAKESPERREFTGHVNLLK